MNEFLWALTFLASLPLSVWLLACLLGLLDQRPLSKPLIRLMLTATGVALFLALTHRSYAIPLLTGFALVAICHAAAGFVFRYLALGVKVVKKGPGDTDWGGEGKPVTEALIKNQENS